MHRLYALLSPSLRRRRMRDFLREIAPRAGERLLDVGGTTWIWDELAVAADITLLNPAAPEGSPPPRGAGQGGFHFAAGDGCALPYADGAFDVVFSNSVIEHLGTWERQQRFAAEARRTGRRLWVQTPAREFFIEPHLVAPFVHWLPRGLQRRLIRHVTLRGWIERPDARAVDAFLAEVRLLTFREMQELFPDCTIRRERFLGLTKSYIAIRLA